MKKLIFTLAILLSYGCLSAQETAINLNEDYLFYQGKTLFEQRNFAASTQYFEKFLDANTNKNNSLSQEAAYYIACNAYELKQKNALTLLQEYLKAYPYSPMRERVAYMIGRSYYENKKYKETIQWYGQLKNNQLDGDENMAYLFTKGVSYIALKDYEPARVIFANLYGKKTIYEVDALYYYSYSEFCLGNYAKALPGFVELEKDSKYAEASSYHLLQIYDQQGENQKAVEYGQALIKKYPGSSYNSEAYRILGEASYREKSYKQAIDYLRKYERNEKKVQRSDMYMLGLSYFNTADYKNAVSYLSKVTTEKDALSQNAYLHIGLSYVKLNDKTNAKMAFQTAAKDNFDKTAKEEAAYNYVLAVYEEAAPFGEAITAFERFIADYPKSKHLDDIYGHLVTIYMMEKNYETAYASIQKIKTSNPKIKAAKENALFQIGASAFLKKDYKQALNYFTFAIAEYTEQSFSAQAFLWRGETYYQLGEYAKARVDLMKFVDQKQKRTQDETLKAYYTIAYSYFEEESFTSALDWYIKFLGLEKNHKNPLFTDVVNRTGDCYYYTRDFDTARKYYMQIANSSSLSGDYAAFQNGFILGIQKKYDEKIAAMNMLLATYPKSDYSDDALYEIGRTYVLIEQNEKAIDTYQKITALYPKTNLARKAALEIGMLFANKGDMEQAIAAYKAVVNSYPSSEEAKVAIESMQTIYVENNQITEYLNYRESIAGSTISTVKKSLEDSLNFVAAERLFVKEKYKEATASLKNYLVTYCDKQTLNCISAQYYLAESYYKTEQLDKALTSFERLTKLTGNPYQEEALIRSAEITYDQKAYKPALEYFEQLFETASNKENKNSARVGILRCSYALKNYDKTILAANNLLEEASTDASLVREARYCRAKSYINNNEARLATDDLKELSKDLRQEMGAEAKYLLAQQLYEQTQYGSAETEIMDFIERNTPHQYWLARAFVLLADVYIKQNDDFQAKQYLISLEENYTGNDDIKQMIDVRLSQIREREKQQVY